MNSSVILDLQTLDSFMILYIEMIQTHGTLIISTKA